jgi:hypothetical protein
MFNATGTQIVIVGFDLDGKKNKWVLDEGESAVVWYMDRWKITEIGHVPIVWYYQPGTLKYVSEEYLTSNWLYCKHATAQIGPDGKIWILPPGTRTIVAQPTTQPAGFPAKPDKIEKG